MLLRQFFPEMFAFEPIVFAGFIFKKTRRYLKWGRKVTGTRQNRLQMSIIRYLQSKFIR